MYVRSLDTSIQGLAIAEAEEKWGVSGLPTCKRKYQPFRIHSDEKKEKLYGCHLHHDPRKKYIERHGPRPGWVDFAQWD